MVHKVATWLFSTGIRPGDRVASYSSNSIVCTARDTVLPEPDLIILYQETAAACLAATALGAIWVSAASDFGPDGVLERFEQVKPKVLFSIDSVMFVIPQFNSLYES